MGRDLSPSSSTKPYMCSPSPSHHPEMPQRVSQIMCRLEELGLSRRCLILPARPATDAELLTCHRSDPHAQGGLRSQCTHANWGLEPGYVELLGNMGGAMKGIEPSVSGVPFLPPVLSMWVVCGPQRR